jgi:hypothetical protein
MRFLALTPDAQAYYDGLEQKRFNARQHVRKILALAEIYPAECVARAIADGLLTRLVFIEETLPDRGAARSSCRGAHADSLMSSKCCRGRACLDLGQAGSALNRMRTMRVRQPVR